MLSLKELKALKNNILDLIQGADVEWENITEVFNMRNGYTPSKNKPDFWDENSATIPWFRMEDIRANGHVLSDSIQHITEKAVKGNLFKANSIIIATSATIGEHALITVDFMCNQRFTCFTISDEYEDKLLPKFSYHYFFFIDKFVQQTQKRSSMPAADMDALKKLRIPIPSLEIQQKVVEILDKMTDYVTKLTAELTLRQKQYSYYRDQLLTFPSQSDSDESLSVRWMTLGEICDVRDGTHDSPKKSTSGKLLITSKNITAGTVNLSDAHFISQEDFDEINKRSKVDKFDILMSMIGTVGETSLVLEEPDFAIKNVGLIKTESEIQARYLLHYLRTSDSRKYIAKNKSQGTQAFFALGKLRGFPVPVPPLKFQSKIVEILDKFQALIEEVSGLLPEEIALRQKQYEYYREQLLSFKKE